MRYYFIRDFRSSVGNTFNKPIKMLNRDTNKVYLFINFGLIRSAEATSVGYKFSSQSGRHSHRPFLTSCLLSIVSFKPGIAPVKTSGIQEIPVILGI